MHPLGDVVHVGDVRPLLRVRVDAHVHQLPELRTQSACAYWACGGGGGGGPGRLPLPREGHALAEYSRAPKYARLLRETAQSLGRSQGRICW